MKKLLTVLLTFVMAVCLINLNNSHTKAEDNTSTPFTITAVEGSAKVKLFKNYSQTTPPDLKYSKSNGNEWSTYNYDVITLSKDESVQFKRGTNGALNYGTDKYIIVEVSEGKIKASGNIMSLIYKDTDFPTANAIIGDYCFYKLFTCCKELVSIDGLELPATSLTKSCYNAMFSGCTGLTSVPVGLLPATNLSGTNVTHCYQEMFSGCTSLTNVPNLPATTLVPKCYLWMFKGCTSLTSIPGKLLPAINLTEECYKEMFIDCTNLTNIPNLPATALANCCYQGMFKNCSKIKVKQSDTKVDNYVIGLKLPTSTESNPSSGMFTSTGGPFTGTPVLGTQYYIEAPSKPTECSGTACSITATKGANSIVAHISGINLNQLKSLILQGAGGFKLTDGTAYTSYAGSLGIVFNKLFIDMLGVGDHQITVYYDDGEAKTYDLNITITEDSPSPSPSKKDESCEKVIGPTWHWNNDKGICEDIGVVGTSTR